MKHLEVRQKYSAARRISNSILSVSSGDETMKHCVSLALYMTQKSQHRLNYQRNSSSCLIISFMYQQNSHVFQRIFIKLGLRAVF